MLETLTQGFKNAKLKLAGKTRLTEEVERMALARGFAAHRALILDFGAGKGQDARRSLVRSLRDVPSPSQILHSSSFEL